MTWVAVAAGGAAVISGGLGYLSSKKAGDTAAAGSNASIAESRRQFDLIRSDTQGLRDLGNSAIGIINRLYGYAPTTTSASVIPAGATAASAPQVGGISVSDTVKRLISPTKAIRGAIDPIGASITGTRFLAGLLGNKHGDEKRNLNAFFSDNKVYDLGDGRYALEDGTTFNKDNLQQVAGAWYGATYAPDGDQAGWQQRYNALVNAPTSTGNVGQAGSGLTSEGVPQGVAADPAGTAATGTGQPDLSVFFASPDYQFRLGETEKALERLNSAKGRYNSGATTQEGLRYASGLASGEFANFYDRLAQQAGLGVTGIGQSASAGLNTASNIGAAAISGANARASSYLQGADAIGGAVNNIASNYLLSRYLRQPVGA